MRGPGLQAWSLILAATVAAVTGTSSRASGEGSDVTGTWESKLHVFGESVTIEMRTVDGDEFRVSSDIDTFDGLTRDDLKTTGSPLRFSWQRASGTILFVGEGRWFGRPSGTFRAVPDPELAARLDADADGPVSASDLLSFVFSELPSDLLPALREAGYENVGIGTLRRLGTHRISGDYVLGMQSLGYRPSPEELIRLRSRGVRVETVERLAALGLEGIPVDDLVTFRRHAVEPDELRGMSEAGFPPSDVDAILQLHRRGLDLDEIEAFRAVPGYELSADDLVSLYAHGVSPGYFAGLVSDAGLTLAIDDVIDLRRHGVPAEDVRGYVAAGVTTAEDFTRLHRHGVEPGAIAGFRSAGLGEAGVDDVIELQRNGVDPAYVRELRDGGMVELSVDRVVDLHRRGVRGSHLGG